MRYIRQVNPIIGSLLTGVAWPVTATAIALTAADRVEDIDDIIEPYWIGWFRKHNIPEPPWPDETATDAPSETA